MSRRCRALLAGMTALCACVQPAAARAITSRPAAAPQGGRTAQVYGAAPAAGASRTYPHLDGALAELARDAAVTAPRHANPALRLRAESPRSPEVLVHAVAAGDVASLERALAGLGARGVSAYSNLVGAWVPVNSLAALDALAQLRLARAAMPRPRAVGPVAVQGDFVQGSSALRQAHADLTGAGVTVGVLSDSFDCYGTYAAQGPSASGTNGYNGYAPNGFTATYAGDQATGALSAGVRVVEEADCENYGAPDRPPFTDEGRAIAQIIHAVAPQARIAFHTAAQSESDFAQGILALRQLGARVIVDDVGYPDEPFFQDGVLAQVIDTVAATGVTYFSSAGNDGRNSWESAQPAFVAGGARQLLNFDTSGATTATTLPLSLPSMQPGEWVVLVLQWDQPFVTGAPGSPGSSNVLNLCLESASVNSDEAAASGGFESVTFPLCAQPNAVGGDPLQILVVGNPADGTGPTAAETLNISVALTGGAAPGRVKFLLGDNGLGASMGYATSSPTIQGHPLATGAIAVGAALYFSTPRCGTSPAVLHAYSSWGGDPILFDESGKPLAQPEMRARPDLVAPDGINDTFLGFTLESSTSTAPAWDPATGLFDTATAQCQNDPAYPNFFGTSAAAPHAAAVAALMLQSDPYLQPEQIRGALTGTALPMAEGGAGSGAGFIQAEAAFDALPGPPPKGAGALDPLTLLALLGVAVLHLAPRLRRRG